MNATLRQELDDMWTVRLDPIARDAMVLLVERHEYAEATRSSAGGPGHGLADTRDGRSP